MHSLTPDADPIQSAQALRRQMVRAFPQRLLEVPLTHHGPPPWPTRTCCRNIGRIDGVHYAPSNGHGISIATYLGRRSALAVRRQEPQPFMDIPHPTRFFYDGQPCSSCWRAISRHRDLVS